MPVDKNDLSPSKNNNLDFDGLSHRMTGFDMVTDSDRKLLAQWNNTTTPYPHEFCIHQLFEMQAARSPDAIAVIYERQQLTYRQLNQKANQLAFYLIDNGLKPDSLVGIFIDRSLEMVISILGVLKAGAAYVPLDSNNPKARLNYMKQDANLAVMISKSYFIGKICDSGSKVIVIDAEDFQRELNNFPTENPKLNEIGLGPKNLVYAIYTSGSTGNPKGVMIEHRSLVNRIDWMRSHYGCDSSDVILQKTPFGFDVSVWEFFLPLVSGARMVLAKPEGHKDPAYLYELIRQHGVTKLHFVPTMLSATLGAIDLSKCNSIKQVFCSGEALPVSVVNAFYKQCNQAQLHNLYGPTEASIDVSYWSCSMQDTARSSVPIGKPINNIKLYVVNDDLQMLPPGGAGELLIGGVGLARGYVNLQELTKEKFIPDIFSKDLEGRLYRTGDLCRFLPNGNIEFIGRIDNQIKIRGFRIEPGEIEAVLMRHDAINEAVVLGKNINNGSISLSAYVTGKFDFSLKDVYKHLEQSLPDYMIPSKFVIIPEIPLTMNGKIDRNALLEMEESNSDESSKVSDGMSFLQREVYEIWKNTLGFENIGIDEDLFTIGGDSIAAIRIFTNINKEFGLNIQMEELFSNENFTIEWLSEVVESHQIKLLGDSEYLELLRTIENMSEEEMFEILMAQSK